MSNRTFLTAHSVIYAFFALALFFAPGLLWPNYGVELNDRYAWFLSQHNSIFLGGIAVISFLFREAPSGSHEGRKILTGLMWTNLLGLAVTSTTPVPQAFSPASAGRIRLSSPCSRLSASCNSARADPLQRKHRNTFSLNSSKGPTHEHSENLGHPPHL